MEFETSFVISTLMRRSLFHTLSQIRRMYVFEYGDDVIPEIPIYPIYLPRVNEYVARNLAVDDVQTEYVTFIDDDAYPDFTFMKRLRQHIKEQCDIITGIVSSSGRIFGEKYHGVGTNLTVKVKVFKELGGFEETWGHPDFMRGGFGWRSDTDLLWRYLSKYGESKYCHDDKLLVHHPEPFKSEFILPIEIQFIKRHTEYVKKYFYPIDPRVIIVNDFFITGTVSEELEKAFTNNKNLVAQMVHGVLNNYLKYQKYVNPPKDGVRDFIARFGFRFS